MSTWNIYHKDGSKLTDVNGEQITVHGLEYSDSWMGGCFVTINFKHEVPINFQIGDYIVYRGERFELNYEPGKDKQARPDTYGEGFVYDSVKFNALQDELARAEFLDVVLNDNELHYTALPKFPFYVQTLDDLLDRIQACLNEQIGAGLWKIYSRNKERSVQRGALESEWLSVYGEKTDDNVIESMSITVDSQTCWQALALVNEKWDINFIVRGRNIYVGTTGIQANHIFKYGLGNGLYEIVQNADSDQSVVTRLRAYGSEKNLPSHYYADLGVKYVANITKVVGASTNVTLELDLDYIETYFKNPRKYIVPGETGEQSLGWVLKVTFDFKTEITGYVTQAYDSKKCRFYSELKGTQTDTGDEESKEKLDAFIAQVKAGNTKMYITSGLNKKAVPSSMKEYAKNLPNNMSINRLMLPGFPHVSLSDFYNSLTNEEKRYVNPTGRQHRFSTDPHRPYIDSINIEQIGLRSASQFFDTDDKTNGVIEIYPTIEEMEIGGVRVDEIDKGVAPDDDGRFGDNETVKNVDIYLKKAIDFDINDLKDDDFSISMKDGMCGGRTFKVASSTKIDGRWRLTIERVKDDALELWFPYKDYPIKKGDHFVLTGITLPDSYVNAASLKLLKYAIAFIDKNDYTRYVYQPKVDEIFMARQHDLAEKDTTGVIKSLHDTLKAGDLMEFEDTDLRIGGVISIDQLTIKEEDGKIPTYDITLREDKEVGTIQKIQQQISSLQSGNGGTGAGLTTTQVKSQVATEGSKHFISKINDDTAKGTITWEKVQKFLQGLLVGGGSWTPDAEGRSHLITDYLEVRMKAIFEELVINKTSTIGGKEIISPAGGVVAHKVEEVTVTYNNVSQKAYRCYFLAEQEGNAVDNDFAVGDQVRSESFNVRKGTYHKAGNHFYWRLVIGRDEDPVELEGKKYHYIDLSDTDCATASDVPAKGDVLNQCGNRTDVERQTCLIFSAVDTYSPSISLYHGINSYSFANREYVEYGVNKQTNKAFFNVYGDMYVGDRPTKENGYEGSSYIRYDSSTKQMSVKAKISAKSTVDGKELSQYIKENTDDTVANEAKKAAEDAQKAAQTAQTDITKLGNTVTGNKKEFDNYVTNGYLEPSEIAAMAQDSKRLEDDFAAAQKSYNEVKEAEVLKDTKELTDLNTAFATLTTAKTELVTYLSDISTNYNKADTTGKATIVSAVGTKFTNFQSAYSTFYDKLGLANAYITRKIYGDLGVVIGDVATYQYLKKVLADGVETEINGGLILTNLIALRDPETKRVESGINGVIDKTAKGNGIATWWGGYMNDGEVVGFDKKEDYSKQAATSLVRFDGSGYMANGAIWWGTDGKVHADPTSFIISEKNLGAYLTFFEPTWKEGSAGTSVADLVSLKPNAPFSKLGVSGDATFEGAISFHGIKLTYDSTNKAIKIDGNLYATGGITAYGAGASTTGGGGLIASVISYARILEGSYTDADLTSIPNAYAIKALSSRIDNIASELGGLSLSWNNITGKPSTFTPSAHTHKWTEITDRITKVSQLTNDKGYLTAHQSLASYYTKAEIDAKGYTTNKGTVTSVALTLPTGLTCATKTITTSGTFAISLASGYSIPTTAKQTAWDGAVSAKHTHSNKSVLDGITSTKVTCWDSAYDWYALITTDEETADGIINKWNEVVSFLANIAQTDTLSGIVDGINKSISDEVTRAKKAEGVNASGISTNKTSITTLQGYFTSGSAKKALQLTNTRKLWGNSFNGTADINGSIIVPDGKYISIGNIKMEYDATNKALKITNTTTNEVANLYTSGGVSAYGVGTSSSSGGGLNGSVKSYADALKLTSESLSEVASAYSIAVLNNSLNAAIGRISTLEGGSATSIETTGSGNAVTSVSKSGTKITFTKGSTFSLNGHTHDFITVGANQTITATQYKNSRLSVRPYYNSGGPTTYGNILEVVSGINGGGQLGMEWSGAQTKTDGTDTNVGKLYYRSKRNIMAGWTVWKRLAFAEELAWGNISGKPTTLSGFGITDGLRSVTQPSGSNVFVTGISTSGTAITYTKSYTKKSLSAVGTSGWTNASIDGNIIPDMSFIAYWNGAYSGTSSNLAYCNKGAFGSFAIKNSLAFSELTSKPTTISGYGITDAYTKSQVDTIAAKYLPLTGGTLTGQLKIEASALNGAYNGLRIGDDCYIGDCNFGNTIGLMGVGNNNAGMVKFGKGGMQFGYNGSNHIASTTAQWTNLNADLLDGWHKNNIVWSGAVNSNTASLSHYWAKLFDITVTGNQYDDRNFTFLFSNGFNDTFSVVVLRIRQNGAKDSGAYNFIISLRELVGNMSSRLRVYYNNATGNVQLWGNCQRQYGSLSYTIIKKTGRTSADFTSQGTLVTNISFSAAQSLPATTGDSPYTLLDGATRIGIVNQADQLVTARTIWGQSFNGTANVSGALSGATTISASNTISTTLQNGALKIGNKLTPISAIDAQVIFNTGAAIRFGETAWDWNQWAGLKYTHSNKTIYLGIADKYVFTANSAQSNGTLKFPGITTITPDGGVRIGGSGGDLYLGNGNNSGFVKVQDMCSQVDSNNWKIMQGGYALFKDITIINTATINGSTHINDLLTAKGIMPTTTDVNAFGTNVNNWDGSIAANVTNMFNGIPQDNIQVEYSMDNGATWNTYFGNPENRFNLINDNARGFNYYLGSNNLLGDTEADKLAQIKKNQLRVTVKIPDEIYQELSWISVDVNNGVDIKCQVYFGSSTGGYKEYVSKIMNGWSHKCDICVGPNNVNVGYDNYRYVRLVFSHLNTHTALRNGIVAKIRALALTKYIYNGDRYTISTTGHIYDYDAYMNTYFPNSILAKGGVTAYQSSDIRLKQDLRKLDYLGIIKAMGGTYGFAWKKDNTRSIGWIAQHVLCNPHLKDIVETDEKGYYKINYWSPKLIATAFGAIEQVGDEVSRLKARVVFLESEVQRLSGDKEDCNKKRLDNKNINSLN